MKNIFRNNFNSKLYYLDQSYKSLKEMITKMFNPFYEERPTCAELLSDPNAWLIQIEKMKSTENYKNYLKELREYENKFYFNYFVEKLIV